MCSLEFHERPIHNVISMHDANTRMCTTSTDLLFKSNKIINVEVCTNIQMSGWQSCNIHYKSSSGVVLVLNSRR
jgi:hypothetical protein